MNRIDRAIGILLALQTGRTTSSALAQRFDVSRRTILRDIDGLSQIGVPIVAIPGAAVFRRTELDSSHAPCFANAEG